MKVGTPTVGRTPRWGFQTSLFQFGEPAFYLFAGLVLAGTYSNIRIQAYLFDVAPWGWALSWLLLVLLGLPVVYLIRHLDLYEREPISLMVGAALWGGLAATFVALPGNEGWRLAVRQLVDLDPTNHWLSALAAPGVEEATKGAGVVLLYLIARSEFDDLMDGFVYGALVGFGFEVVEDVLYFIDRFGGGVGQVLKGFYIRVIASGAYSHMLYTGLTGIGVAYFATRKDEATLQKRIGVAILLFLAAITAHFLWNSPLLDFYPAEPWQGLDWLQIIFASAVKGGPALILMLLLLRLARRREQMWLTRSLSAEVGRDGLSADEFETLAAPAARRHAIASARARSGNRAGALMKRLHREQFNLAMVATRVSVEDDPDLVRQRRKCLAVRESLQLMTTAVPVHSVAARSPGGWIPTHMVPEGGMDAWQAPDPSVQAAWHLPAGSELRVVEVRGAWARVDAPNGWTGWVDDRRLVQPHAGPVA